MVRLLRERSLGNRVTQLRKKLYEQYLEDWLMRALQYFTACQPFAQSSLVTAHTVAKPPEQPSTISPQTTEAALRLRP